MAKLIFSLDGAFLGEYALDTERITIGRRPTNDIHIDNLAVSGEHAVILTIGNDSFLEDLGSTNGTLVNGKPVQKYVLQHGDLIEFGKYQLKYINEAAMGATGLGSSPDDFEKTMIIRPSAVKAVAPGAEKMLNADVPPTPAPVPAAAAVEPVPAPASTAPVGKIQVLNGPSTGKELVLNKALTTLGKPGVQVAVITKRPQGYFITHVEGQNHPIVNGQSVGAQAHALNDHDIVEIAGVKMEFYLTQG
ncbi:MAG TPA: FHA domain-containing protein [Methylophilaceae bacterium]|nr:FHA domain-containing protein [Methylophilaceae bacterium]